MHSRNQVGIFLCDIELVVVIDLCLVLLARTVRPRQVGYKVTKKVIKDTPLLQAFRDWKETHVKVHEGHCILYTEFQDCYYNSVPVDLQLSRSSLSSILSTHDIKRYRLENGSYGVLDIELTQFESSIPRSAPILVEDTSSTSLSSCSSDDIGASEDDDDAIDGQSAAGTEGEIRWRSWIKSPMLAQRVFRALKPLKGRSSATRCPDLLTWNHQRSSVAPETKNKWWNQWRPFAQEVEAASRENRPLRSGSCRLDDCEVKIIVDDDPRINLRGQKGVFLKLDAEPLKPKEMLGPYRSYVKQTTDPIPSCTTPELWHRYQFVTQSPVVLEFSAFDDEHANITRYINDFRINPSNSIETESKTRPNVSFCTCLYRGFPQVLIQVDETVLPGQEVLLDYGDHYFINDDWKQPLPRLTPLLPVPPSLDSPKNKTPTSMMYIDSPSSSSSQKPEEKQEKEKKRNVTTEKPLTRFEQDSIEHPKLPEPVRISSQLVWSTLIRFFLSTYSSFINTKY